MIELEQDPPNIDNEIINSHKWEGGRGAAYKSTKNIFGIILVKCPSCVTVALKGWGH